MIKRIPVSQLKLGMYIHDLNCHWLHHPFVRNQFLLKDAAALKKILAAGVRELFIDTDKGLDVEPEAAPAPPAPSRPAPSSATVSQPAPAQPAEKTPPAPGTRVPFAVEIRNARQVHQEAVTFVRDFMRDIRLGKQVEMEQAEPLVERITESIFNNQDALLGLSRIKEKDDYTFKHSISVCALLVAFCRHLNVDRDTIRQAGVGGLLHDIGKMKVPEEILNKPGRLTDDEFAVMKGHVTRGLEILQDSPGISPIALEVTGQHHERQDGTGYPLGLKGEEVSRLGQMASIVDVYDAITSERVYRTPMQPTDALRKLVEWSPSHFRQDLVEHFIRAIGIYPTGTLVRLENDQLAVVVAQSEANILYPLVRVVYDDRLGRAVPPRDTDLQQLLEQGRPCRIVRHEAPDQFGLDPFSFL